MEGRPSAAASAHESSAAASQDLPRDGWKVKLLVDVQELVRHKKNPQEKFLFLLEERLPARVHRRSLPVGDYLWVARHDAQGLELLLPYVIERKSWRNLQLSIWHKSTMYPPLTQLRVQHFKMKFSKLEHRQFLVEGDDSQRTSQQFRPDLRRNMSILQNLLQDDPRLTIQETGSIHKTIDYLVRKHESLERELLDDQGRFRNISSPTTMFTFDVLRKNVEDGLQDPSFQWYLTLKSIRGMSDAMIKELREEYSSESRLKYAFEHIDATFSNISKLRVPDSKRCFGKVVAASLRDLFTDKAVDDHSSRKRQRSAEKVDLLEILKMKNIPGLSVDRIHVIQKHYPTRASFMIAFQNSSDATMQKIANLKIPRSKQRMGREMAESLQNIFVANNPKEQGEASTAAQFKRRNQTIGKPTAQHQDEPKKTPAKRATTTIETTMIELLEDTSEDDEEDAKRPAMVTPISKMPPPSSSSSSDSRRPSKWQRSILDLLADSGDDDDPTIPAAVTPATKPLPHSLSASLQRPLTSRRTLFAANNPTNKTSNIDVIEID